MDGAKTREGMRWTGPRHARECDGRGQDTRGNALDGAKTREMNLALRRRRRWRVVGRGQDTRDESRVTTWGRGWLTWIVPSDWDMGASCRCS